MPKRDCTKLGAENLPTFAHSSANYHMKMSNVVGNEMQRHCRLQGLSWHQQRKALTLVAGAKVRARVAVLDDGGGAARSGAPLAALS